MKLHVLGRSSTGNTSFSSKINKRSYFLKVWHSHPELELATIIKSKGVLFIGDGVEKFEQGDIVLIGKGLPHMLLGNAAFSHFFKRINGKTFSHYITGIRIDYACKLLLEEKYNISTICYESGFQNLSNFNRQFKLLMSCTPTEYLNTYSNK